MQQRQRLLAAALLAAFTAAQAQTSGDRNVDPATANQQAAELARGDPARWHRPDASSAARLRTLQKEIGAALQEARNACRRSPAPDRAGCLDAARATYQQDMASARSQGLAAAPN
jgi:hypothetical protein